jgi:hypothetical protein
MVSFKKGEIMKHIIVSRVKFKDKKLLKKYLIITKDVLIPSLKSQTNKNFTWGLIIDKNDINYIKSELDFNFISFNNNDEFVKYVKNNNVNIQTRHDIDDWMSFEYISKIQEIYIENIEKYDSFLIQSQPLKLDYRTGEEKNISRYTATRTSMHLTLCQKNIDHTVHSKNHGQMYQICKNIITLPEGYTKWVIHGDNISCKNNKNL